MLTPMERNLHFGKSEKRYIAISSIKNPGTRSSDIAGTYYTEGCDDTEDKIFLLSLPEVETYFSYGRNLDPECKATAYAIQHGICLKNDDTCDWWTRSPGKSADQAACPDYNTGFNVHCVDIGGASGISYK